MAEDAHSRRDFGYWLNMLANLAVVAGILFLALEVRQNSRMMQAQIRNELAQSAITQIEVLIRPDVLAALYKGDDRSPLEDNLLLGTARILLRGMENSFYQYRLGLYDTDEYAGERLSLQRILGLPWVQQFWSRSRAEFSREFQELVDSLIAVP